MSSRKKQPIGIGKTAKNMRKVWTVNGDNGESAYALLKNPKVKPGNAIHVETANQLGCMRYKVIVNEHGEKKLKPTYDPNDYFGGGVNHYNKTRKGKKSRSEKNKK